MRAALIETFGSPLRVGEIPDPPLGPGEVVVSLTHAGINPIDLRLGEGSAGRVPLPFVPGCDGVGAADGSPVVVYGSGIGLSRPGTYAERVAAPEASVVPIPAGVDPVQAAGIGLAGVTAWGIVHGSAAVTAADRVLVLGASGGVGTLVVQLARATGARVWSHTATEKDVALQRQLGAEEVVVGGADELREAARPLAPTVVIDALGGAFTGAAVLVVAPGGRLVVFGASAGRSGDVDMATLYRKAVTIRGHAALTTPEHEVRRALEACLELMATGGLRAHIDAVMPLDEVNEAHRRLAQRETTGRLVLSVAG
jgi:NADPH2:quinone reductase